MSTDGDMHHPITILMAEDDPEDRMMTEKAFAKSRLANDLRFVEDGEQLMSYLRREEPYADPAASPTPGLILLDLNMPRKDGREALAEMKADANLRHIPVIALTTSGEEQDVLQSYDLGVNSYIIKPVTFRGLVEALEIISRYWLQIVRLPCGEFTGETR